MPAFDTPWTRRLRKDFREMEELRRNSSVLEFEASGDPPDKYLITFKGRGLVKTDGKIGFTDRHQAEVTLSLQYPRVPPTFRWLTPIHHPNIWGAGTVCLRDFWSVMKSRLIDAVAILWDMARLQILNPRSAYTGGVDARKEWAELEQKFGPFPVDERPIDDLAPRVPEEPGEEEPGIVIMGAAFPTEGATPYSLSPEGRPVVKTSFPLLRAAVGDLYARIAAGELRDQPWYFRVKNPDYPSDVTCIRAFALLGKDGRRDTAHAFGWCFDDQGQIWRGKWGREAIPSYLRSTELREFTRDMVALDFLADNEIWGPWSEDFDPMVVESLWWIFEEEEG